MSAKSGGLAGITAGASAVSTVSQEGVGLTYRGYSIEDLAKYASFEEVAFLLFYGKLPTQTELDDFCNKLIAKRELPEALKKVLELIPRDSHPMDVLRTACSMLGNLQPENNDFTGISVATFLFANFPGALMYWYHFHQNNKRIETNLSDKTFAGYILHLLHQQEPDPVAVRIINASLILYAEHEFNASTFGARVTAATLSDFYSAICTAIGTLRGPLHGGANEAALDLIMRFKSVQEAKEGVKTMLAKKELIMGFGHRVYQTGDPRSPIIKELAHKLAKKNNAMELFNIAECIEKVMWDEKNLFPNLDFYSALAYHFCGFPQLMFTPLFVFSRITGWSAHVLEQRANNKLIRPLSEYTGPDLQTFLTIDQRD